MNILTIQESFVKEKDLLRLYSQSSESVIKFKCDFNEFLQIRKNNQRPFFFKEANTDTFTKIKKMIPLCKRLRVVNLDQQQNGLFKILTFMFLLAVFNQNQQNQYVKQHLKCSLYSNDVDLLEIKNHSFNKKMQNHTIKSVLASFFNEVSNTIQTKLKKNSKNVIIEDFLSFILEKNDIISQGFHLFFRSILTKFEVQNSSNCLQEVSFSQTIQSLVDYFEIDCRIHNNLYLFPQTQFFIAKISPQIIFGSYFQNQLAYQKMSDKQIQNIDKSPPEKTVYQSKIASKPKQRQKDYKIFNFLPDNEISTLSNPIDDQIYGKETPYFQQNQEIKLQCNGFNKFKNRLLKENIDEILSQQEELKTLSNLSYKNVQSQQHFYQNRLLKQKSENEDFIDKNQAPAPMLDRFVFEFNQRLSFRQQQESKVNQSNSHQILKLNSQLFQSQIKQIIQQKNPVLTTSSQIKKSAIRRQSYQGQNSNQSQSSDNLKQESKSGNKNQIKVIDGASSQVNLRYANDSSIQNLKGFNKQKNNIFIESENISSYSNYCTCYAEKKTKIKLNSQILSIVVNTKIKKNNNSNNNRKAEDFFPTKTFNACSKYFGSPKNSQRQSIKLMFKTKKKKKSTQNFIFNKKTNKQSVKQHKQTIKNPEFIKFLQKDKKQLIKKLSQKRSAKINLTSNQNLSTVPPHQNALHENSEINPIKKSMFVGSYNSQNLEKSFAQLHSDQFCKFNTANLNKSRQNCDQRPRTSTSPNQKSQDSTEAMKLFKIKYKPSIEIENITNTTKIVKTISTPFQFQQTPLLVKTPFQQVLPSSLKYYPSH